MSKALKGSKKVISKKGSKKVKKSIKAKKTKPARKVKETKSNILLNACGRLRRKNCAKKGITLFLKTDVNRDMQKYCFGNKQTLINYLVRKSLDDIIKKGKFVLVAE